MSYDLAVNLPLRAAPAARLRDALANLPVDTSLLGYPAAEGSLAVREAIAAWLRRHHGFSAVDPRRLVLTNGARHALVLALAQSCAPGDALLMEELTYAGYRQAVIAHGARPVPVAIDGEGMLPDALEAAARRTGARVAYVHPTLHNPTTATMSPARREAIVDVARRNHLTLIEGDVYGALRTHDDTHLPALADLAPERVLHAGGIGKILGPGLRIGWLLSPDDTIHHHVAESIRVDTDGLPALLPAIVGGWMADGTADALLDALIEAIRERHAQAREALGPALQTAGGLHAWLPHPDADGAYARALAAGVRVTPPVPLNADDTKAGRGLRLCLAAEESPERLAQALQILATLL
ncbi:PLP-dependent aminotransferase family protein [Bacillus sp. NP157]|nr:PLP-dependent aminotransferase family protein [Bacillus sp. NP157]